MSTGKKCQLQKVGKIVGLGILITDLNTKGQQYFNDFATETVSEKERGGRTSTDDSGLHHHHHHHHHQDSRAVI